MQPLAAIEEPRGTVCVAGRVELDFELNQLLVSPGLGDWVDDGDSTSRAVTWFAVALIVPSSPDGDDGTSIPSFINISQYR